MTHLKRSIGTALAILCLSQSAHAQLPAFDQEPYTHAHRLVTIAAGRKMNIYCIGQGSPTVILDAGGGGPTAPWRYVQTAVSRLTRVCSYDRAGQGFSDPGPLPRDTAAIVDDLHALLRAADLKPPYIFVGHSMAGLQGILYADRYLPELAGMLLIDPSFADQGALLSKVPGLAEIASQFVPSVQPCLDVAKSGKLPTNPELIAMCFEHHSGYGPALVAASDAIYLRPSTWESMASEAESFTIFPQTGRADPDSKELDDAMRNLGSLDLVILTAGNRLSAPGLSPAQADGIFQVINAGHAELAARSSRGVNEQVSNAGHMIQFDSPEIVINHITRMVLDYRKSKQPE